MNTTLTKALVALVPTMAIFAASVAVALRSRTVCSWLQLLGAACLVVVVLTHVCEALQIFPTMHWGQPHSLGHYVDFVSAVAGLTLVPIGYVFGRRHRSTAGPSQ